MKISGKFERDARQRGYHVIAGLDEVGRGALFGPVFAAAVVLAPERPIRGLRDSKELPPARRELLAERILVRAAAWGIAAADAFEIDRLNILQASKLAMTRALAMLNPAPDCLLVDAVAIDSPLPQQAIIHGDALSFSIAAASILAKVERDACMREWDKVFPQYGFKNHKGYSTPEHWEALRAHGPTPLHRFSFWPVRDNCPHAMWAGYPKQADLFERIADAEAGEIGAWA